MMRFELNKIYHVYNRGNNRQQIFFSRENYLFFLRKLEALVLPHCDLLAYCLMPNHFHLLIHANHLTLSRDERNNNPFSEGMRKLLSQYCKAVNAEQGRVSSLFQQNTRAKLMPGNDSALNCFLYIHNNPSYIVGEDLGDWEFSSYREYMGVSERVLCNMEKTASLLELSEEEFEWLAGEKEVPVFQEQKMKQSLWDLPIPGRKM